MWLEAIVRPVQAQSTDFGPGDWIALGLALALFLAAVIVPNVLAGRATGRRVHRPGTGVHGRATGATV
jgi:hypothetical protein